MDAFLNACTTCLPQAAPGLVNASGPRPISMDCGFRHPYGLLSKLWSPFGSPKYYVPYYTKDPKRDHNLDNHPYATLAQRPLEAPKHQCLLCKLDAVQGPYAQVRDCRCTSAVHSICLAGQRDMHPIEGLRYGQQLCAESDVRP